MRRSHLLVIIVIFLLVGIYTVSDYMSSNKQTLLVLIVYLITFITALSILFGKKKVESKIAWMITVLFVPIIGFLFYIILGIEYNRFTKFDDKFEFDKDLDKITRKTKDDIEKIQNELGNKKGIIDLVYNTTKSPVCLNNKTEILTNGDIKFERLISEIKKAKKFIHLEYFIINDGKIFKNIKKVLIEKSKEGVEIRILYDDMGCVNLPAKIIRELNDNNIKTASFNQINFKIFRPSINYRNHRKIVVIDNKVAFTGGINIGDEYAHMDPYYGFWRDSHILIEGSAVRDLNIIFIKDWYHTTNELLDDEMYTKRHEVKNTSSAIQVIADGPDNQNNIIRDSFFKLINDANERIWITTPYLILDVQLISALKVAALAGKDVRIIVPYLHDKGKKLIYKATEAYFSELLVAGVKIYRYKENFIHSKIIIIDDDIASIGTVNFDYRSLDLHFEDTVLLYLDHSIKKLINDYENDLAVSKEVKWAEWKKRNFVQKAIESMVRIFSPLL